MNHDFTSFEDNALDMINYSDAPAPRIAVVKDENKTTAWRDLLGRAIEREILPRLLTAKRADMAATESLPHGPINEAVIAAVVELVIDDDMEQLRALADRVILLTGGREALLNDLLTPAARILGEMWDRDVCDFMTVTLGVYRLNQIMRETAASQEVAPLPHGFDHRILLLPAPGEQHSFGLSMVADAFREGGWCVRSAPGATRSQLLRLVKDEWFDVIGLSVSSERWLNGLPSCIRAVRAASCNPAAFVMVGGRAIMIQPERTRFLGADGVAADAGKALAQANLFMETTVTERFCPFKTKLGDVSRAL
jgi:methanogenic corrinoid protein MtbC1